MLLPMADNSGTCATLNVDVVITAYQEDQSRIDRTIDAWERQSPPVGRVLLADDGSNPPLAKPTISPRTTLLRFDANRGISATRNAAAEQSDSDFIAFANIEVLPATNWAEKCSSYLRAHSKVGAVCSMVRPVKPRNLITRWRYRFQEELFQHKPSLQRDGPVRVAPGHAVMFRRTAFDQVGGYNSEYRLIYEDGDISFRLQDAGWEVHLVTGTDCISIQEDSLRFIAKKQLVRSGWVLSQPFSYWKLLTRETRWLFWRMGRNACKARVSFLPVDVLVWLYGLKMAWSARRKLRSQLRSD